MLPADRKLGVAVCGVGWCASQHITAFQRNPRTAVTWLCARDADRARASLAKYGIALPHARITTSYDDIFRAGRGHRVDRDAEPLARDGGVEEFGDLELTLEWNL